MDQKKIGQFIAQLRKEKNMTQEELASNLNVTDRAVSNWETGRRMPDITSLKNLCDIFSISFSELLNGEKLKTSEMTEKIERTLFDTYDKGEKNKHRLKKTALLLTISIIIIILMIITIFLYFKIKYPKIESIQNIAIAPSSEKSLEKYIENDERSIWFYATDSVQLHTDKGLFSLRDSLKHDQLDIDKISAYLEKDETIKKYTVKDTATLYKDIRYTAVICNTQDGNKDIYFGIPDFEDDLVGTYCGRQNYSIFTRTYYVNDIMEDNDKEYINLSLSVFQSETALIRTKRIIDFQLNKSYEFKFKTSITFEDTIQNVFDNSQIIEVKETDKGGLEQINENLFFE